MDLIFFKSIRKVIQLGLDLKFEFQDPCIKICIFLLEWVSELVSQWVSEWVSEWHTQCIEMGPSGQLKLSKLTPTQPKLKLTQLNWLNPTIQLNSTQPKLKAPFVTQHTSTKLNHTQPIQYHFNPTQVKPTQLKFNSPHPNSKAKLNQAQSCYRNQKQNNTNNKTKPKQKFKASVLNLIRLNQGGLSSSDLGLS